MTNAVMLQAKEGFTLTSDIINAMKQLFGEKIKEHRNDLYINKCLISSLSLFFT